MQERQKNDRSARCLLELHLGRKKTVYEQFGVPAFWVVDPRVNKPSLTVFELTGGCCRQVAQVSGDESFRTQRPFAVEAMPSAPVVGLMTD